VIEALSSNPVPPKKKQNTLLRSKSKRGEAILSFAEYIGRGLFPTLWEEELVRMRRPHHQPLSRTLE
jgi:hypothetical protein